MNTKNKIIAILMAGIVAMAIGIPAMVSAHESGDVNTSAMVPGVGPTTVWQEVKPDVDGIYTKTNVQIEPVQNGTKEVEKCILVHHPNGLGSVADIEVHINNSDDSIIYDTEYLSDLAVVDYPANCWDVLLIQDPTLHAAAKDNSSLYTMYNGTWLMGPCVPHGMYHIQCRAYDGTTWSAWEVDTFEILSMMGIDLDLTTITFGPVAPGMSGEVLGDDTFGVGLLLTVKSTNNAQIDVKAKVKTTMDDGGTPLNTIPDANVECKVDTTAYQALGTEQTYDVNLGCGATENVDLKLTVDSGQPAGSYSGALTFTAIAATP